MKTLLSLICTAAMLTGCGKNPFADILNGTIYPEFTGEQEVVITGYSSHAMEPFISKDGNHLFFNSLNDGIDTSLCYATAQNETSFVFAGNVGGVNGTPPHLDAVASMDDGNRFYFVSTRNWPSIWENYQSGVFDNGAVNGVMPVSGDFYIREPGWIIMDAEISRNGNMLYYVNSKFSGQPLPDESKIGIAEKQGSNFVKNTEYLRLLEKVNNDLYIVYAPSISSDGKSLFFTRLKKGTLNTEICISIRKDINEPFMEPRLIPIAGELPEAATVTGNGERIYYHKKTGGYYKIFTMRKK